ncbi:TIGR03564 family F420-dependent LLM class oxidoreductase [Haloechinothrix salitolerans]|uniref:TIGR03564 family F420-dependent LLM class oxidoreductase n=1 Tax=Haloechinothrix salitolerans TaxID=926830 RepID=A0ABW2C0U1_9PSEU
MRIGIGVGGEVIGEPIPPGDVVEQITQAEADGFDAAWTIHTSRGIDALSALSVAGSRTSRIELGVGVVPTYPRHPVALAQQAATVQALSGGRLTLGVGVSHKPAIEGLYGIPYTKPAAHMRDYLSVLVPVLRDGSIEHDGEFFSVHGGFDVPGASPVSVVVAALSPLMTRVAGDLADGVVTWLAGPRTVESVIQPALAESTARAPRVIAGVPLTVCDDGDAGRARASELFARYGTLTNYQRLFEREGVASPGELAVVGTEEQVAEQLRRFADAGVTELWPTVFGTGDDSAAAVQRTKRLLLELDDRGQAETS